MRRLPLLFILFAGCHKGNAPAPPAAAQVTVKFEFVAPQKQMIAWSIDQPGTVHAFEVTSVVAKLPGFVSKVYVDLGDRVVGPEFDETGKLTEPGQLLAEISVPEQTLEAKQKAEMVGLAEAEVEQAKSNVTISDELIATAEAMVKVERAGLLRSLADTDRWASELKRVEGLSAGKVVDAQTLDESRKQFASAQASQAEAEAKVFSAEVAVKTTRARKARAVADVAAAVAKRKVADADAAKAEAVLAYTRIRAPFNGVVTSPKPETGRFVQPAGSGHAETLFTVARLDPVRIFIEVPEASAPYAVTGTPVTLRFPALNHREVAGEVTRTAKVLSNDSRTLKVEIDLPNSEGTYTPGLYCTVNIRANTPDAWVLPLSAILNADETSYCFQLRDGKIAKLRVQVGRTAGTVIEVLRKRPAGTTAGDWQPFDGTEKVAVGNLGALAEGQAIP